MPGEEMLDTPSFANAFLLLSATLVYTSGTFTR
jgi:hypothetical protein